MNKTSAILQSSTSVTGRRNAISQPAQSPVRWQKYLKHPKLKMSIISIKHFAEKYKLPEISVKNIFIQALSLAATNKFKEYEFVEFNIESENFVCYSKHQTLLKPIKEIGRLFLTINCEIYFQYLLNATYPETFKFKGNVTEKIQEIYDRMNNVEYKYEKYNNDGPYCSACMQAPCMCSDREQSSSLYDF